MEWSAILVFWSVELATAGLVFRYWIRHRSELDQAKVQLANALKDHKINGTLQEFVANVAKGKELVYKKRKQLHIYLLNVITMILGIASVYCMRRYTSAGVVIRTISGCLSLMPFIASVAIAIAEEADENKISHLMRSSATRLLENIKEGKVDI